MEQGGMSAHSHKIHVNVCTQGETHSLSSFFFLNAHTPEYLLPLMAEIMSNHSLRLKSELSFVAHAFLCLFDIS